MNIYYAHFITSEYRSSADTASMVQQSSGRRLNLFLCISVAANKYWLIDDFTFSVYTIGTIVHILVDGPEWMVEPMDRVLPVGEPLRLHCLVNGQPAPTIRWFKDGSALHQSTRIRFLFARLLTVDRKFNKGVWIMRLQWLNRNQVGNPDKDGPGKKILSMFKFFSTKVNYNIFNRSFLIGINDNP